MHTLRHSTFSPACLASAAALAALAVAGGLTCPTPAAAGYAIRGYVIANGGTPPSGISGSGRVLVGTAGQPVVGVSSSETWSLCHGFWCLGGWRVIAVEEPPPADGPRLPTVLAFGMPRPNPARDAVRFAVDLPKPARVDLRVLDVQGRLVGVVASGGYEAGFLTLAWDGRDASGQRAGAGLYFVRLLVDGRPVGTRRIALRP